MSGILYGIGTGPGDPELLTIKAVRIIKECDMIALPVSQVSFGTEPVLLEPKNKKREKFLCGCTAYNIVSPMVPEIQQKEILFVPMPMIKNKEELKKVHDTSAEKIIELIKEGKKVGFLTLGDPTIYSTYLYLHNRVAKKGIPTQIICGIPSFCAAAARLNQGLAENKEQLHIIPASYGVGEALKLSGTKVLMKSGKKLKEVTEEVAKTGQKMQMVEDCGMKTEKVYHSITEIPQTGSYYSLIMVKGES